MTHYPANNIIDISDEFSRKYPRFLTTCDKRALSQTLF